MNGRTEQGMLARTGGSNSDNEGFSRTEYAQVSKSGEKDNNQVNYQAIYSPNQYDYEYWSNGKIKSIKQKEQSYNSYIFNSDNRNDVKTSTYVPYEISFDEQGNKVKEVTRKTYKSYEKDYDDRDEERYAVYDKFVKTYSGNVLTRDQEYDVYDRKEVKSSRGTKEYNSVFLEKDSDYVQGVQMKYPEPNKKQKSYTTEKLPEITTSYYAQNPIDVKAGVPKIENKLELKSKFIRSYEDAKKKNYPITYTIGDKKFTTKNYEWAEKKIVKEAKDEDSFDINMVNTINTSNDKEDIKKAESELNELGKDYMDFKKFDHVVAANDIINKYNLQPESVHEYIEKIKKAREEYAKYYLNYAGFKTNGSDTRSDSKSDVVPDNSFGIYPHSAYVEEDPKLFTKEGAKAFFSKEHLKESGKQYLVQGWDFAKSTGRGIVKPFYRPNITRLFLTEDEIKELSKKYPDSAYGYFDKYGMEGKYPSLYIHDKGIPQDPDVKNAALVAALAAGGRFKWGGRAITAGFAGMTVKGVSDMHTKGVTPERTAETAWYFTPTLPALRKGYRKVMGIERPEIIKVDHFPKEAREHTVKRLELMEGEKIPSITGRGTTHESIFINEPKYAGTKGTEGYFSTPGTGAYHGVTTYRGGEVFLAPRSSTYWKKQVDKNFQAGVKVDPIKGRAEFVRPETMPFYKWQLHRPQWVMSEPRVNLPKSKRNIQEFYRRGLDEAVKRNEPVSTIAPKTLRKYGQPEYEAFNVATPEVMSKYMKVKVGYDKFGTPVYKLIPKKGYLERALWEKIKARGQSYKAQLFEKDVYRKELAEWSKQKAMDIHKGKFSGEIIDNAGKTHVQRIKKLGRKEAKRLGQEVDKKLLDAFAETHDIYKQPTYNYQVDIKIAEGIINGYYDYLPSVKKLTLKQKRQLAKLITLDTKPPINPKNIITRRENTIKYSPYRLSAQEKIIINADRLARFGNKADPKMIFNVKNKNVKGVWARIRNRLSRKNVKSAIKESGKVKDSKIKKLREEYEYKQKEYKYDKYKKKYPKIYNYKKGYKYDYEYKYDKPYVYGTNYKYEQKYKPKYEPYKYEKGEMYPKPYQYKYETGYPKGYPYQYPPTEITYKYNPNVNINWKGTKGKRRFRIDSENMVSGYQPEFITKGGRVKTEDVYVNEESAIREGMKVVDETKYNKFVVKKKVAKRNELKRGSKYSKKYKFHNKRGLYTEKKYYRFDSKNERRRGAMNILNWYMKNS
jgi:hypothetical protein